jgi:predicted nucleic acid-binding protein
MTAVFADTNIVVYAYAKDPQKSPIAEAILMAAPVISTQVVSEFLNIARTKMGLDLATRHKVARDLLYSCAIVPLDAQTVAQAMTIEAKYQVSYWDALVVAAALAAGCETLYTEDLQNRQVFESLLVVKNPFVTTRSL